MHQKKSIFQIVIFGAFAFFIVVAVFVFAGLSGGSRGQEIGEVVVWGTYNASRFEEYVRLLGETNTEVQNIVYEEVPETVFQGRLAEALADGTGPDLFIINQANLIRNWNKLQPFSYETISERTFKDTYIDESEMFMSIEGLRALPFSIDPLVLYWNRDIFAEAGFAQPPVYWDEVFGMAEKITQRDKANNVLRATIAFGEYDNVAHAKDIIAMLIMQAGGEIVQRGEDRKLYSLLLPDGSSTVNPAQTAVRFYTEFANPIKAVYSWNRSMPYSIDAFAQGKLALYVGYASEAYTIQEKNPHLNYDVAPVPQIRGGENKKVLTFGTVSAFAVPKAARNPYGGQTIAMLLTSAEPSRLFSEMMQVPSPRRDILKKVPEDPVALIFRNAALISRGWFDPNPDDTNRIFRRMVGDVTSGALRLSDTVQLAHQELGRLVK